VTTWMMLDCILYHHCVHAFENIITWHTIKKVDGFAAGSHSTHFVFTH